MTISPEQHARIRRLFFGEHWKVGTIATELGVHPDTVKRAIEAARFATKVMETPRPSMLDAYKPFILDVLDQHPRLRATRILQMLRVRGYVGGYSTLRRYVRQVRPTPRSEAYLLTETLPGEQGQVDWGSFGTVRVGHATRKLSVFVMVLGWSRAFYARFTLDQQMESFLRGHVEAFAYFGGAPRVLLYDNLKSVVLDRVGEHVRFHPRILDLAGHHHFEPRPCAPYRGNEKGKVERVIQYLRHSFFAARRFSSVADLNAQLQQWLAETALARIRPTDEERRTVRACLDLERPMLVPLPEHGFDCEQRQPVRSGKRPYVRFDRNDYSIPHGLVRKPLTLLASETVVRVVDGDAEVARHERSYDKRQVIEDPAHIEALAAKKKQARELRGRDRLRATCPHADAFLAALAERNERLTHNTTRLVRLLDQYGAETLDAALAEALDKGAIGAAAVAHLCDRRHRAGGKPPAIDLVLSDDPRVQTTTVIPHDPASYDALTDDEEHPHE
jgi:transposase